jgi:hypothetical protein
MDLDINIEDIEFSDDEHILQERREVAAEIATQEQTFLEDESFIVQNALFDRSSKNLILEKIHSKNNKISKSKFDFKDVPPPKISKIHKPMGDALEMSVDDMEVENIMLK